MPLIQNDDEVKWIIIKLRASPIIIVIVIIIAITTLLEQLTLRPWISFF